MINSQNIMHDIQTYAWLSSVTCKFGIVYSIMNLFSEPVQLENDLSKLFCGGADQGKGGVHVYLDRKSTQHYLIKLMTTK